MPKSLNRQAEYQKKGLSELDYNREDNVEQNVKAKSLAAKFSEVTDQRKPRGIRYPLAPLLSLILLAKLCGQDTPVEIAEWVAERAETLKSDLGLSWKRMPHHSTYRRVMAGAMKIEELEKKAGEFMASLVAPIEQSPESAQTQAEVSVGNQLAIDGKTLRGTISTEQTKGLHLVSIYQVSECATLAQVAVKKKENEISASPQLLKQVEMRNKTVSGDAMLAQKELSKQIVKAGGDYLLVLPI
ncbi:MAG TPA: ISAs1 family transposase [Blastocatellia bacterium]|nr:ISAs1 family transposase [Blastocatellia bacterium]HMZ18765.1 ISAs1 family transposase [Blastocatellia bacterium]